MAFTSVIEIDVKDDNLKNAIEKLDDFKKKFDAINQIKLKLNTENFHQSADKIMRKLSAIDKAMTSIQQKSLTVFNAPSTMAYSMAIADVSNKVSKLSTTFSEALRNKKMLFSESGSTNGGDSNNTPKATGGNWFGRGWGNFIPQWPGELKKAGMGGVAFGGLGMMLNGMKTIATLAIKLPFQVVGVGLKLAMKGIKLLMASVKGILGLLGSVFKGLGIGVGAFGGLVTAGVLGMYSRASSVSEKAFFSRAALGMNPGDIDRINAGMGRFVDAQSFMSKVAEQQNALYSPAFARMGVTQQQARGLSTERAGEMILEKVRNALTTGGMKPNELSLRMLGVDQLMSVQDAQRISSYTKEQFDEILTFTRELKKATEFKDAFQWERFKMRGAMGMAKIEAVFTNEMVKLTDPLDKLFGAIYNSFSTKGGPNLLSSGIDYLNKGINRLREAFETGNWSALLSDAFNEIKRMGSMAFEWLWGKFKEEFPATARHLTQLGKAIKDMLPTWAQLETLGGKIREMLPTWDQVIQAFKSIPELWNKGEDAFWDLIEAVDRFIWRITHWNDTIVFEPSASLQPPTGSRQYERRRLRDQEQELLNQMYAQESDYNEEAPGLATKGWRSLKGLFGRSDDMNRKPYDPKAGEKYRNLYEAAGAKWGVSPDILMRQGFYESGFNPNAVSPEGAAGISQFMPDTARKYGLKNPFDVASSIEAQAHMMRDLLDKFNEDYALALGGYNWGENREALQKGDLSKAPIETKEYIKSILEGSVKSPKESKSSEKTSAISQQRWNPQMDRNVQVTINDQTSSNITVAATRMYGSVYA